MYVGTVRLILLVFAQQKKTLDCQQSPLCALFSIHHPHLSASECNSAPYGQA